jgi:hypothetical protein
MLRSTKLSSAKKLAKEIQDLQDTSAHSNLELISRINQLDNIMSTLSPEEIIGFGSINVDITPRETKKSWFPFSSKKISKTSSNTKLDTLTPDITPVSSADEINTLVADSSIDTQKPSRSSLSHK